MKPSIPLFRQTILEVERKFCCNPRTINIIQANKGTPSFQKLESRGQKTFEDIYYDSNNLLFSRGIWVRTRDGVWQAKVRRGGDFTNSQFRELEGTRDIRDMIESLDLRVPVARKDFGLSATAEFKTKRHAWRADGMYNIVVDSTDFGHSVGEVELQQEVALEAEEQLASRLDAQIEAFMSEHSWAFPSGNAVGKLSAYFDRAKARQSA
ncbi:hypothetical protein MMC13_006795 [Lambiella insularis]|nr:hypothetical protein [Lambiella insularis]